MTLDQLKTKIDKFISASRCKLSTAWNDTIVWNVLLLLQEIIAYLKENSGGGPIDTSDLVPKTRKVNGKTLDQDVILNKVDVGLGNVPNVNFSTTENISDSLNKRFLTESERTILASGLVLETRTINGKSLNENIELDKSDVGLSNVANVNTTTTANISDSLNKRFVTDTQVDIIDDQPAQLNLINSAISAQYEQIDYLQTLPAYFQEKQYLTSGETLVGAALNGATVDLPNKTVTIPSGVSGNNTIIEQPVSMTGFQVGDRISFRVIVNESVPNSLEFKTSVNLKVINSGIEQTGVTINYEAYAQEAGLVILFDYILQQGDTRLAPYILINSTPNSSGSSYVFTLSSVASYNNLSPLRVLENTIENIPELIQDANGERMLTVTTLGGLRGVVAEDQRSYFVSEEGKEGIYTVDTNDTSTPDNGSTVLISSNNKRLKLRQLNPIVQTDEITYTHVFNANYANNTWITFLPVAGYLESNTTYIVSLGFTTHLIGGNLYLYKGSGIINSGDVTNSPSDYILQYFNGNAHRIVGGNGAISVEYRMLLGSSTFSELQFRVVGDATVTGNIELAIKYKKVF